MFARVLHIYNILESSSTFSHYKVENELQRYSTLQLLAWQLYTHIHINVHTYVYYITRFVFLSVNILDDVSFRRPQIFTWPEVGVGGCGRFRLKTFVGYFWGLRNGRRYAEKAKAYFSICQPVKPTNTFYSLILYHTIMHTIILSVLAICGDLYTIIYMYIVLYIDNLPKWPTGMLAGIIWLIQAFRFRLYTSIRSYVHMKVVSFFCMLACAY